MTIKVAAAIAEGWKVVNARAHLTRVSALSLRDHCDPAPVEEAVKMATIKASCPSCGDVELTAVQVRLVVCSIPDWSFYAFTCHECREEIRKPAGTEVVSLLRSGGVKVERWTIPAEARESHEGPAIGYDDVLDFALWLEQAINPVAAIEALHPGLRVPSSIGPITT